MSMYNGGMYQIINQTTNWATADIRVLLVNSAYAQNKDSVFVSDVTANEISTTNYVRKVLAGLSITQDDTNDRIVLDATDPVWTALGPGTGGPTIGGVVAFRNTGADGTSPLLSLNDLPDTQVNGSDLTVVWNAAGVITATSP